MQFVGTYSVMQKEVGVSNSVPRILLVDDDPVLLQGLSDMLTYRLDPVVVVVHASSDDVATKVRECNYDVVVCDGFYPVSTDT